MNNDKWSDKRYDVGCALDRRARWITAGTRESLQPVPALRIPDPIHGVSPLASEFSVLHDRCQSSQQASTSLYSDPNVSRVEYSTSSGVYAYSLQFDT
jgi:hypothetical protein